MKKIVLLFFVIVTSLVGLTSCGKKDEESKTIVEQEVDIGTNLENKATDNVNKQA